jgi:hypothetical protein
MLEKTARVLKSVTTELALPVQIQDAHSQPLDLARDFSALADELGQNREPRECKLSSTDAWIRSMKGKDFYARATEGTGCTSIRQVQRKFEPNSFRRNELSGIEVHDNRWRRYKEGLSAPDEATVKRASRTLRTDLREDACSTLWLAIDPRWDLRNRASNLLCRCSLEVSTLHGRLSPEGSWHRRVHVYYSGAEQSLLATAWHACQNPTMQSLTGLTVLYRWIARRSRPDGHRAVAKALHFVLLSVAPELIRRHICAALFAYYLRHVFPLTEAALIEDTWAEMVDKSALLRDLGKRGNPAASDDLRNAFTSEGPVTTRAGQVLPRFAASVHS